MKCTLCGYAYIFHDWEAKESMQKQINRTEKKVADHWKRDHRDIVYFLKWMLRDFKFIRPSGDSTQ